MSNTYANYNKFRNTKIYGNLEVKDYVNSGGTTVDIGTMSVSNSLSSNVIGSNICSCGALDVLTSINTDSIQVNSNCQFNYKMIGYIISSTYSMIPLCKSIFNPSTYCSGSINLITLLNSSGLFLYLFPTYQIVMYDSTQTIIWTIDNTNGTDILYISIPIITDLNKIIIYNNYLPIL
jgi:hypothetical protein